MWRRSKSSATDVPGGRNRVVGVSHNPDYESAEAKRQCALILLIEAQNRIKNAMAYLKDMPRAEKRREE
jgi:hypothetical protein